MERSGQRWKFPSGRGDHKATELDKTKGSETKGGNIKEHCQCPTRVQRLLQWHNIIYDGHDDDDRDGN